MSPETETRNDFQQVINNLYTSASLVVASRRVALQALSSPPYYPDIEDWADRMWTESGVNFWSVPPSHRLFISEQSKIITPLLFKRADFQSMCSMDPEAVKTNLVSLINQQIDKRLYIDPDDVYIAWGLFSFGMVLGKDSYKKIDESLNGPEKPWNKHAHSGYITGRLMGDLGPIPIILRGTDQKRTLLHEDLHVLQANLGYMLGGADLNGMLQDPELERITMGKTIKKGDLDIARKFLGEVAEQADRDVFIEFQTYLWEGRIPNSNIINDDYRGYVNVALGAMFNAIYHPSSKLTNQEKIEETFNAQHALNRVNDKVLLLHAYAHEAMKNYKGPLPKTEWVAALAFVMPPFLPIEIIKVIMLGGRHKELSHTPKRSTPIDLAGAISTYARRTINPKSWGQGDMVQVKDVDMFVNLIATTCSDKGPANKIIAELDMDEEALRITRQYLLEYSKKSVPAGLRGQVERRLRELLV
jgi:hypothetical protein